MKKIFCFTGASHTGKSTFGNFLKDKYNFDFKEVSARPFLEKNISYDKQVDDIIQTKIMYNNIESFWLNLCEAQNNTEKNILLSRCPIDVLAYTFALHKGEEYISLLKNTISLIKDKAIFIYTPSDFPMTEKEDIKRGMNELIREKTDFYIRTILDDFNIPHFNLSGSFEEKKYKLNEYIKDYLNL